MLAFGGARPDGSRYVTGELVAGGAGASRDKDGVDVIETDATNCMNLPAEALELDAPIRVNASPCCGVIPAAPARIAAGSASCANTRYCTAKCALRIAASGISSPPRAAPAARTAPWRAP